MTPERLKHEIRALFARHGGAEELSPVQAEMIEATLDSLLKAIAQKTPQVVADQLIRDGVQRLHDACHQIVIGGVGAMGTAENILAAMDRELSTDRDLLTASQRIITAAENYMRSVEQLDKASEQDDATDPEEELIASGVRDEAARALCIAINHFRTLAPAYPRPPDVAN